MHRIARYLSNPRPLRAIAACCCLLPAIAGCADATTAAGTTADPASACEAPGRLEVETFGAIQARIDWRAGGMQCEGMRRPDEAGARLRFAGQVQTDGGERQLAFIFSLPDLVPGQTGTELRTRVTLIEENAGRFFSTQEAEICWSNISRQEPRREHGGKERYSIAGLLYCVAPIAELNGTASVTLSELTFVGQLSWAKEES